MDTDKLFFCRNPMQDVSRTQQNVSNIPHYSAKYRWKVQTEGEAKAHHRIIHEGPEGELKYSYTRSLISGLHGDRWFMPLSGRFTPGKETTYPLYRKMKTTHLCVYIYIYMCVCVCVCISIKYKTIVHLNKSKAIINIVT